MNLLQLQTTFWWLIDDEYAIEAPMLTQLINDAIRDLSKSLRIIKYVELTPAVDIITFPSDMISVERALWHGTNDRDLVPIHDIAEAKVGYDDVVQYYMLELHKAQLFGSPTATNTGTVKLWYKAYAAPLVASTDVPTNIPEEYHQLLVSVYVRAMYSFKVGQFSVYQNLASLWEDIKSELTGVVVARTEQVVAPRRFDW